MTNSQEQTNSEQAAHLRNGVPVGAVALTGVSHEDPLAGDVDRFVHPDETRSDDQIAHDEGVENRLHMSGAADSDEYWADYDDYYGTDSEGDGINPEDFKKEVKNPYILTLEKTIKERGIESGLSEADLAKLDAASFLIKDADGNPEDTLRVSISHYEGMYSRPGVQSFELKTLSGEKRVNDWPVRSVRGSFWGCEQSEGRDSYSMSYDGNSDSTRQWVAATLQPEVLAAAEVQFHLPEAEQAQ